MPHPSIQLRSHRPMARIRGRLHVLKKWLALRDSWGPGLCRHGSVRYSRDGDPVLFERHQGFEPILLEKENGEMTRRFYRCYGVVLRTVL